MSTLEIRKAVAGDSALIHRFITELARYEEAEHEVIASEGDIRDSLFGDGSSTRGLICSFNGEPIGFAVYFFNYSTWLGKHGVYLEDLYVSPQHRGTGAGTALLKHLANIALSNNCGRLEWSVLDWNEPAINFYEALGAKSKKEWIGYQLTGETLTAFANS